MEENHIFNIEKSLSESTSKQVIKCKYCFIELSSRLSLREHVYTHSGDKPYICTEPGCGECFSQGSHLSVHKRIHFELNKGRLNGKDKCRGLSYPKLTDLLINHLDIHKSLHFNEINSLRLLVKEEDFTFVKPFLI